MDKAEQLARLPARVRAVIAKVDEGARLCKFIRKKETGDSEINYFYEPSGRRCGPKSAEAAIATGLLRGLGDGLFDEGTSQTWAAAP